MTPQPRDAAHQEFEELAVGYALGALEPEDEERAAAHLGLCRACRGIVDSSREVAGDMAHAVPQEDPPASLWAALRAELPDSAFTSTGPPVVRHGRRASDQERPPVVVAALPPRNRAWRSLVGAAAVLSMVLGLGAWNLSLRDGGGQVTRLADDRAAVLRLMEEPATVRVPLASNGSALNGSAQGAAVLAGDDVWLVLDGLAPNDSGETTYVLWSTDRAGRVTAVAPFDVTGQPTQVLRLGSLGLDRADLTGFAVTHEQGRSMPSTPGSPTIVTGTVPLA